MPVAVEIDSLTRINLSVISLCIFIQPYIKNDNNDLNHISIEVNCPVYYLHSQQLYNLPTIFESVIANQKDSRFDESLQFFQNPQNLKNSDDDVRLHTMLQYMICTTNLGSMIICRNR